MIYRLIEERSLPSFEHEVNKALSDGWTLSGGVSIGLSVSDDIYKVYTQALIFNDKQENIAISESPYSGLSNTMTQYIDRLEKE